LFLNQTSVSTKVHCLPSVNFNMNTDLIQFCHRNLAPFWNRAGDNSKTLHFKVSFLSTWHVSQKSKTIPCYIYLWLNVHIFLCWRITSWGLTESLSKFYSSCLKALRTIGLFHPLCIRVHNFYLEPMKYCALLSWCLAGNCRFYVYDMYVVLFRWLVIIHCL